MAAYRTFGQCIEAVQTRLSEVPGVAASLYSEDILGAAIQSVFDTVFEKLWLPEYRVMLERTLDGSTGIVTEDVADTSQSEYIDRWTDLRAVFPSTIDMPLRLLPSRINPTLITGTTPRYISPSNTNRLIKVWPLASTGDLVIIGRQRPAPFTLEDTVKLPTELVVVGALAQAFESDSTSPGAADMFSRQYNDAFRTLRGNLSQHPIELAPSSANYPTQWEERDY